MDDLISRQAAIEYFMTNTNWHDEDGYEIHDAADKRALLESYFDGIPSAQPEQKVGKWIGGDIGYCTCCGHKGCASDIWNACEEMYCPNCGAKMEEQNE